MRLIDVTSDKKFHDAISETIEKLESLSRTATNQRAKYKRLHIRHAALTMSTKDLSRLLLQKAGDLLEPEHMIYDEEIGRDRPCQSSEEVMSSTKTKTQQYMNPSSADRQNHFCSIPNDEVGPSGINIQPNRPVNDKTMKECKPKYEDLPEEAKEYTKEAHRKFKCLLENSPDEAPELRYAFFYDQETGEFSDKKVKEDYDRSILTIPGKARHDGFHMSLIGRLPKPWVEGVLIFLQNVLASRCPPPKIKEMTRIPIPKGDDKPGQTRPISLADDIFSFLTGQISRTFAAGIEETGRLGPEITAYRKNKSTTDITIDERGIMEDALEFCQYMGLIKEDEEKFFDRVVVELHMLAMKLFGCPDQGYCEWKMEDMVERDVNIVTRFGNVWANFLTGVPQGSTLSVHIANLIIWVKHRIMGMDEVDPTKKRGNPYTFQVWDTGRDDEPVRFSFSYCDDNDAVHGAETMEQLYKEISKSVRMTGYFSVVTKLGRAGSKSTIHLYNLDPRYAARVKEKWKFESYAWSFAHGSIMKDMSQENKDAMKALEKRSGVVKSLGVLTRSDKPDSRATGKVKCQQALMRISQMSLNKVDDKLLSIIINSLVVSIAQFAALEANITSAECGKVDRAILNKVRRGFGLSQNDMKNVVF